MIKKRKVIYIIAMILFELFQQTYNVNAAGIVEGGSAQPSGTINVSLEEYQELLRYKWEVANYESLHPNAANLATANDEIEKLDTKNRLLEAEIEALRTSASEPQKGRNFSWDAGASYIYAPGNSGVALELGIGYKHIMPTVGIQWQAESGLAYSLGVRYYR
jgi:hypothetical protein